MAWCRWVQRACTRANTAVPPLADLTPPPTAARWTCSCPLPEVADDGPVEMSDSCREEVYQYKIARNANINKNIPLGTAH